MDELFAMMYVRILIDENNRLGRELKALKEQQEDSSDDPAGNSFLKFSFEI